MTPRNGTSPLRGGWVTTPAKRTSPSTADDATRRDTIPPAIEVVHGKPKTGGNITVSYNVTDRRELATVWLGYSFDGGVRTNSALPLEGDRNDMSNGTRGIQIPGDAARMTINITATDTSGNDLSAP